eukprot:492776_1
MTYRKYSNIIPDILYDDIKFEELTPEPHDTASPKYEKNTLDIVNTLLYQRPGYCFTHSQTIKLFENILQRYDEPIYPIEEGLNDIKNVHKCLDNFGAGGTRFVLQLKQCLIGSLINYDENFQITNKQLLDIILPQTKWMHRFNLIDLCLRINSLQSICNNSFCVQTDTCTGISDNVKKSIVKKYENSSLPHPSQTCIHRVLM